LMVDLDNQQDREEGLKEARRSADDLGFEVLLATPNPEREAWVLHGFEPGDASEKSLLEELIYNLGFDPRLRSHRLRGDASVGTAARDAKLILGQLANDLEREERCLKETPLGLLEQRGKDSESKLGEFFAEIRRLLPRAEGRSRQAKS
jgi:hypothetical protein